MLSIDAKQPKRDFVGKAKFNFLCKDNMKFQQHIADIEISEWNIRMIIKYTNEGTDQGYSMLTLE